RDGFRLIEAGGGGGGGRGPPGRGGRPRRTSAPPLGRRGASPPRPPGRGGPARGRWAPGGGGGGAPGRGGGRGGGWGLGAGTAGLRPTAQASIAIEDIVLPVRSEISGWAIRNPEPPSKTNCPSSLWLIHRVTIPRASGTAARGSPRGSAASGNQA